MQVVPDQGDALNAVESRSRPHRGSGPSANRCNTYAAASEPTTTLTTRRRFVSRRGGADLAALRTFDLIVQRADVDNEPSSDVSNRRKRSGCFVVTNGVPANFEVIETAEGTTIQPKGDWLVLSLGEAPMRLAAAVTGQQAGLDLSKLGRVDTSGAFALMRVVDRNAEVDLLGREDLQRLRKLMESALDLRAPETIKLGSVRNSLERLGRAVADLGDDAYQAQAFTGQLVVTTLRTIRHPRLLRWTPLVATMEHVGLAGLPIVVLMTFFIGAVLALVGSTLLQTLGVTVYAVELVGIGILREFGAVIAAILFAGRSASAFAAQLGSMKMNQEIDAMKVMGVDLFEALVLPRVLAALIMVPLLTLAADLGGLAGGMLVSWTLLSIEPSFFLQRLIEFVGTTQFWIGMAKAPFFAVVVAITGCRQGLLASGDVESLGLRVTSAVVQSIFLIIMFDALFAVMFQRLEL